MSHSFLEHLGWRAAVKEFDPQYTLDVVHLQQILEAVHMAPSSFGLQPYHVYVVGDRETKVKLRAKGYDQHQFTDASHILVFAARTDLDERITRYMEVASGGSTDAREKMKAYEDMMRGMTEKMDEKAKKTWAAKQTYIALGFALAACAELGVDSCPMEGFDSKGFDEVLKVPENMSSVVVMSVGKRMAEPKHPKVRFPNDDLFTTI